MAATNADFTAAISGVPTPRISRIDVTGRESPHGLIRLKNGRCVVTFSAMP
jgi:hypothetical protein